MAVGVRLASHTLPKPQRVLQVDGTLSPSFRWPDPARTDDPAALLHLEGVAFDDQGRADQAQRLSIEDLASLAGVTVGELPETLPVSADGRTPELRDRFVEQLAMQQDSGTVKGVLTVLDSWTAMGGTLLYGQAGQTSCFLMARDRTHPQGSIWPIVLYPLRSCEVVFQHLSIRTPFDDIQLREELRQRLNKIPDVNLAASKISLRPAFPLARLADSVALEVFIETLDWFQQEATRPDPAAETGD